MKFDYRTCRKEASLIVTILLLCTLNRRSAAFELCRSTASRSYAGRRTVYLQSPLSASFATHLKTCSIGVLLLVGNPCYSIDAFMSPNPAVSEVEKTTTKPFDACQVKVPYERANYRFERFLGQKATVVFNMKLDDPQTSSQFPALQDVYKKYHERGLNVLAFPTEQGYYEPDDSEVIRRKVKDMIGFGEYPSAVVFDKVDLLGPSANPLFQELTQRMPTPGGTHDLTLNYEKFLLDSHGEPVRRYPRRYSAFDMEPDIQALLRGDPLPEPTAAYKKAWREAAKEVPRSEYAFRFNYNYYSTPDSMYRYDPAKDAE